MKGTRACLIWIFIISFCSPAVAQFEAAEKMKLMPFDVLSGVSKDVQEWTLSTFNRRNIKNFAGLAVLTGVLVATDYQSWQALRIPYLQSEDFKTFSNYGVAMGDGTAQFALGGSFLALGALTGNMRAIRTAAQITEAILSTGIVIQVLKHTTGRESPFLSEDRTGMWRLYPNQMDYHHEVQKYDAMPSGHIATAMATLIVVEDNFPEQKWIPYVGYPVVAWVGVGLTATSIHWWSDFPLGLAIGYTMARTVTHRNDAGDSKTAKKGEGGFEPILLPAFDNHGNAMLTAAWAW